VSSRARSWTVRLSGEIGSDDDDTTEELLLLLLSLPLPMGVEAGEDCAMVWVSCCRDHTTEGKGKKKTEKDKGKEGGKGRLFSFTRFPLQSPP